MDHQIPEDFFILQMVETKNKIVKCSAVLLEISPTLPKPKQMLLDCRIETLENGNATMNINEDTSDIGENEVQTFLTPKRSAFVVNDTKVRTQNNM